MKLIRLIIVLIVYSNNLIAQQSTEVVLSQNVFREEFNESNSMFPIEQIGEQFAVLLENEGQYFLGSGKTQYTPMINWENDLTSFELKTSIKLAPEEKLNLFQNTQGQTFGIILQYNPNTQEALIFETNSFKKYRLVYIKKDTKNKNLTYSKDNGWVKSENIRKNAKNEILIKKINEKCEFYINGDLEFKINLSKKRLPPLKAGRFGFHLGNNTKVKIDYLYISTTKEYNGINKKMNFNEEEIKIIINENTELKTKIKLNESEKISELNNVIKLLENELKSINILNDSLTFENKELKPFKDLMGDDKDFIYTLSKNLKEQIEKNNSLKEEKKQLLDSITTLIQNQELFKIEYLNVLMNQEKKDSINTD